jgi:hypothetical protein
VGEWKDDALRIYTVDAIITGACRMTHHSYQFCFRPAENGCCNDVRDGPLGRHVIEAWQCDRVEVVVMASWSWQNPIKHTGQEETSEGNAREHRERKLGGMVWLKAPNLKQDKKIVKGDLSDAKMHCYTTVTQMIQSLLQTT